MSVFSQEHFINGGLAPVADGLAGTVNSDVVNTAQYDHATFVVIRGVATGGTADHTFTVEACSLADGTGAEAVPFKSRGGALTGAALGALTARTAAGYTNVAGSNRLDVIEVEASDLPDGKPFVRLHSVEVTNDPVVAAILTILGKPRYAEAVMPDATV
jgi:hypothetical protein